MDLPEAMAVEMRKTHNAPTPRSKPRKSGGSPTSAQDPVPLPSTVERQLNQIAQRVKWIRILEGVIWIAGVLAAMILTRCLLDRWMDFPQSLRIGLLALDAALVAWLVWVYPIRAIRHTDSREQCALRMEKRWPNLRSALISSVQLAAAGRHAHGSPAMRSRLLRETQALTANLKVKDAVGASHLKRPAIAVLILVVIVGTLAIAVPDARLLLARYLGSNHALPRETRIRDISGEISIPIGGTATLAARAEGVVPRSGRVLIRYANGERREFPVSPDPAEPGGFSLVMENVQSSFTYQFSLNDARGEAFSVTCQTTPVIRSLTADAEYPSYTGWPAARVPTNAFNFVAGTRLKLTVTASQPLASATVVPRGDGEPSPMSVDSQNPETASLTLPIQATGMTGFSISLVNKEGIASRGDAVYPMRVDPDRPPKVELLEPADPPASVTPAGGIDIVADVTDDFGIASVQLCVEVPDETGDVKVLSTPLTISPGQKRIAFRWTPGKDKDLAGSGKSLTYYLSAKDNNTETGPGVGESARSTLAIVTAEEKQAEIDQKLRDKAAEINQLRESQRSITDGLNKILQTPNN